MARKFRFRLLTLFFYYHLKEQVKYVRMVVSPLWRGQGNSYWLLFKPH